MRPASCKAKGRRLQQRVVADILGVFPGLCGLDVFSTSMGCGGVDVRLSSVGVGVFPFSVECKCSERLDVWGGLAQAEANCLPDCCPLLVFKRNGSRVYVVLEWGRFLGLVSGGGGGGV